MKIVRVQIDARHAQKLLEGGAVTIKVPAGAEALQLNIKVPVLQVGERNYLAEVMDVFFNGRKAR